MVPLKKKSGRGYFSEAGLKMYGVDKVEMALI